MHSCSSWVATCMYRRLNKIDVITVIFFYKLNTQQWPISGESTGVLFSIWSAVWNCLWIHSSHALACWTCLVHSELHPGLFLLQISMPAIMTMLADHAAQQLLDFNQKLDINLLDNVVNCLHHGVGPQVGSQASADALCGVCFLYLFFKLFSFVWLKDKMIYLFFFSSSQKSSCIFPRLMLSVISLHVVHTTCRCVISVQW